MAEIRRDRLIEAGFVVRNDNAQVRQPVEPLAKRRRRRRPRQFEHGVEGVLQGALPGTFQGLVHGGSLGFLDREAGLLRKFWQERSREAIWPGKSVFRRSGHRFGEENASNINIRAPFRFNRNGKGANARFDRHKPEKIARGPSQSSLALVHTPRTQGLWPGLPSQEASGRDRRLRRWPNRFGFSEGAQRFIAGWSSPVARQAHNLKVIGSNPIPATK